MKRKNRTFSWRYKKFFRDVLIHTPVVKSIFLLAALWLLFSAALYLSETGSEATSIVTYGNALYWGIAAFSTAGIADRPVTGAGELIGGVWIVVGSMLFFGAIVSTITAYFMRPLQRPAKQIIDTIEYNLEHLEDLSIEELELLKETTDALIENMERLKSTKLEHGK